LQVSALRFVVINLLVLKFSSRLPHQSRQT